MSAPQAIADLSKPPLSASVLEAKEIRLMFRRTEWILFAGGLLWLTVIAALCACRLPRFVAVLTPAAVFFALAGLVALRVLQLNYRELRALRPVNDEQGQLLARLRTGPMASRYIAQVEAHGRPLTQAEAAAILAFVEEPESAAHHWPEHHAPAARSAPSQARAPCPPAGALLPNPGYHLVAIERGELGEISKVQEELDELRDAMAQGSRVMAQVELSDMLGAIQAFLDKHIPGTTIEDLQTFSAITQRAFRNGQRASR